MAFNILERIKPFIERSASEKMAQIWKITQNPPKPQSAEAIKTRMREISSATIITPEVTSNIPTKIPLSNES